MLQGEEVVKILARKESSHESRPVCKMQRWKL